MADRLPLDAGLAARTPPEVLRLLATLLARVEQLEAENRDLKARLGLNSSNSSKPPSTDPLSRKRKPPVPKSGRAGRATGAPATRTAVGPAASSGRGRGVPAAALPSLRRAPGGQ